MTAFLSWVGVVAGFLLLSFAVGSRPRSFAVRLAAGLSWVVASVGMFVYSLAASNDLAWGAAGALVVGGAVGVVFSVLEWLFKGVGAVARKAGDK